MKTRKLLFVGGMARSGTSALVRVLNTHRFVVVGQERYGLLWNKRKLTPEHFKPMRFISYELGDTVHTKAKLQNLTEKLTNSLYIGDKFPRIFEHYDFIDERFPNAEILYILRNPLSVAESFNARFQDSNDNWKQSYQLGIYLWNRSVAATIKRLDVGKAITIISYETFFSHKNFIDILFNRLDLDPSEINKDALLKILNKYRTISSRLRQQNEEIRKYVALKANYDGYRRLITDTSTIGGS